MRLDVTGLTHRGLVREGTDDSFLIADLVGSVPAGRPLTVTLDSARPTVVAVADGLGGHSDGRRASRVVLQTLADRAPAMVGPDEIVAAIEGANAAAYEEMARNPDFNGMGTTLAGFAFAGELAWCFNVGDSPCYRYLDGTLIQLSVDDVPPPLPDQDPGAHSSIVTQTLGGTAHPTPLTPHILALELQPAATLLACTDGLSSYVSVDQLEAVLAVDQPAAQTVTALLSLAFAAGAPDNISVLLIFTRSAEILTASVPANDSRGIDQ